MVGGEGEHAGEKTEDVVGFFGLEKGAVSTIVKNDEGTNRKRPAIMANRIHSQREMSFKK